MARPYPFSAIVGQDEMKDALLMATVEPALGGVLVFGDRGTGKSTAVRALAELTPELVSTQGCRYNCDPASPAEPCKVCGSAPKSARIRRRAPMVDLPLGATEDRVCGALDIEKALVSGERAFEPGLLAKAHRGFLYVDEVNLLEDHLVDLLLDVAASGVNVVEREGLSVRHPARFVLVGSGNPEEGELRPQLLDRFGLSVDVASPADIASRIEVLKRRDAYEQDPEAFHALWEKEEQRLARRIAAGRKAVAAVELSERLMTMMAHLCMQLGVDGLRGELTLMRAARAKAALSRRKQATVEDVLAVAPMALRHRLRRDPLDEAGSKVRVDRAISELAGEPVGNA
ncbi:magnesium chelatase ATPase subunit I [Hoeflea sp.]|uniref:magnesium chelatase ATPase subunit I n=1 Tax=Hoeflea sp. TaxID=1940281 RepID=UPI003B52D0C8